MSLQRRHFLFRSAAAMGAACGCGSIWADIGSLARHPHVLAAGRLLSTPEPEIDFAEAKVAIDRLVDPGIDGEAVLAELDAMAKEIRALVPPGVTGARVAETLRAYLYEPGPWNKGRPFDYDFSDPTGTNIPNKLLARYLRTRRGNCVSMPFLYIALAQKLGLTVSAATAPQHVFVKLRDDRGVWHNIETVSGGYPRRDKLYHEDSPMTPQAIANGIYMRPLSKKETVIVMADLLLEHHRFGPHRHPELVLAIADVILEHDPSNVNAMLAKGRAYFLLSKDRFESRYASPNDIPESERDEWLHLSQNNRAWFARAEALGWREPPREEDAKYLDMVRGVANQRMKTGGSR